MNNEPPNPRFMNAAPLQPQPQENQQILQNDRINGNIHNEVDSVAKVAAWNHYNDWKSALYVEGNTAAGPPQRPFPGQQPAEYNTGFPVSAGFPLQPPPGFQGFPPHSMQQQPLHRGHFPSQPIPQENHFMNSNLNAQEVPPFNSAIATPVDTPKVAVSNTAIATPVGTPKASKSECKYVMVTTLKGHTKSIAVVKFSPCGKYLGTASADKQIKIWRVQDMQCEKTLSSHKLGVNDISWSSNSQFIVSGSDDTTVKIFCVSTGNCIKTLKGHTNYVFCCTFNPQSSLIASGGYDDTLRIWDVKTGKCVRDLPAHSDPITSVSFNHDGSCVASSSFEGCIRIWDISNGACLKTLVDVDHSPITYVSFTPNGKFLVSSQLNSTVKVWDFAKSKPIKYYSGHTNEKYCVFANISVVNGKKFQRVISGSEDGKIYIWDMQTKKVLQILSGHESAVLATDSHPTHNMIASGGLEPDHIIRIWFSNH